jgi:hypothetical protein
MANEKHRKRRPNENLTLLRYNPVRFISAGIEPPLEASRVKKTTPPMTAVSLDDAVSSPSVGGLLPAVVNYQIEPSDTESEEVIFQGRGRSREVFHTSRHHDTETEDDELSPSYSGVKIGPLSSSPCQEIGAKHPAMSSPNPPDLLRSLDWMDSGGDVLLSLSSIETSHEDHDVDFAAIDDYMQNTMATLVSGDGGMESCSDTESGTTSWVRTLKQALDDYSPAITDTPTVRKKRLPGTESTTRAHSIPGDRMSRRQKSRKQSKTRHDHPSPYNDQVRGVSSISAERNGGVDIDLLVLELRMFLDGDRASLLLPPTEPAIRKIIHEFASRFGLKSKSVGKGQLRRPTLTRTKRTGAFTLDEIDQTVITLLRRHLSLSAVRESFWGLRCQTRSPKSKSKRVGGEGRIVGGTMPEIDDSNKGRAMLQKMGWSSGTALGAHHNKGRLLPVLHTMKTSKGGLGIDHTQ